MHVRGGLYSSGAQLELVEPAAKHGTIADVSQHILLTHGGIGFGTRAAGSFGVSSG